MPIRRTDASYLSGGQTTTEPTLGVPAAGLHLIHGWRSSDARAPLASLAQRLVPAGPLRNPGPILPPGTRWLVLPAFSPAGGVDVTADLRSPDGSLDQVPLGQAPRSRATLRARVPAGHWELEALELDEPSGLEATNGHQNAESVAPATRFGSVVRLGSPVAVGIAGRPITRLGFDRWRAVGAASALKVKPDVALLRFAATGSIGLLRPSQPSDLRPIPVLVDPRAAAAAGRGARIALTSR